eukprot:SAG22_NODE_222_length_14768_cov_6.358920_9_plen_454_part_00
MLTVAIAVVVAATAAGAVGRARAAAAAAAPAPAIPRVWKATYAAADPVAAQQFAVEYLGATAVPEAHPGGNGTCALIKWVVFEESAPTCEHAGAAPCQLGYQLHFVDLFSHRVGNFTLQDWRDYMEVLNGNISFTGAHRYNQYMDNHVGVRVADARPYFAKLRRDKVPYFTRRQSLKDTGCDLFVQIPNNGIIFEFYSGLCPDDLELQNWDLCHYTNNVTAAAAPAAAAAAAARARLPEPPLERMVPAIPPGFTMHPWKMTYAASDPEAAANWTVKHLGTSHIQHSETLSDTCGRVRWVEFGPGGYQLHFVHNPRKADTAPGLKRMALPDLEKYLTAEHGDLRRADTPGNTSGNAYYDQYMDNHVGLFVDDVALYANKLAAEKVPYFTRGSSDKSAGCEQAIFFEIPGGIIFELAHKGPAPTPHAWTPWDLCKNSSATTAATADVLPPSRRPT